MTMRHPESDPVLGDLAGLEFGTANGAATRRPSHADELEYAGFWVRLGAMLIDTALLVMITMPLLVWIYGWQYLGDGRLIHGPAEFLISWVAPAVATVLFWLYCQATPGKLLLSLRVVDAETGKTVTAGQAVARYLTYILSMLPLCLGFVWVAFDRRKQGWHDKIAQTVVVRARNRGPEPVRFGNGLSQTGRAMDGGGMRRSHQGWFVIAAIAIGALLVAGWVAIRPQVQWVPYRTVLGLTELRLLQVPVHQPYPPGTVCYGGYLERVDVHARTSSRVTDDRGRPVSCLP